MRIAYIDSGNVVHDSYMYQYYGDLFRELKHVSEIQLIQANPQNINEIILQINSNFDCIIFGLGYFAQGNSFFYKKFENLKNTNLPVVCMIHKPQLMLNEKLEFCKINNVDLIVDSQFSYKEYEKLTGIKSIRLPFTATSKIFYPRNVEKKYDIGFSGALHGTDGSGKQKIFGPTAYLRSRVHEKLIEKKRNIFWNASDSVSSRISSIEEYATKINESIAWLTTTGPMLDVGPRYFEIMLSKTLLLCNRMIDIYENYFRDGVNCVMFDNDLSDFDDKLDYYLNNKEEINKIIETAYKEALNNYTWHHMAENLIREIQNLKFGD